MMKMSLATARHGGVSRRVDLRDLSTEVTDLEDYDEVSFGEPEAEYVAYREDLLDETAN